MNWDEVIEPDDLEDIENVRLQIADMQASVAGREASRYEQEGTEPRGTEVGHAGGIYYDVMCSACNDSQGVAVEAFCRKYVYAALGLQQKRGTVELSYLNFHDT